MEKENSASSEGLVNLKAMVDSLKEGGPTATAPSSNANTNTNANPPNKSNGNTRRNKSSNPPSSKSVPTPSTTTSSSTLNPNAGGFSPSNLIPISDHAQESLITPTASTFDLMTGLPRPSPSVSFSSPNVRNFGDFSTMAHGDPIDGTTRTSTFSPALAAHHQQQQQQQQQQMMLMQAQAQVQVQSQQYQIQAQQLAMGYKNGEQAVLNARVALAANGGAGGGAREAEEMMREQLRIQLELENLRVQQENLLARFVEVSGGAAAGAGAGNGSATTGHAPQGHRRLGSQGGGGSGGGSNSFSQGMGNFGVGIPIIGSGATPSGGAPPPSGHAKRHSVKVSSSSHAHSNSISHSPPKTTASGGGMMGNFQFPNSASAQNQQVVASELDFSGATTHTGYGHHRRQSGSISSLGGWSMSTSLHSAIPSQVNLAEAQAHLHQLAVYRSSAGHSRVPSFGMSGGGLGPGQLSMSGYGGGIQQGQAGGQMRKSLFAPYLPQASIPPLLASGKLVIGVLRVNKRNRSDAYVATDVLDSDIYICGSKDRNRALEGDVVAIELLDVDEVWGTKKEKEDKKRKKEESTSFDPRVTRDLRKQDKKKDDVEVEGQGLMLFEEEEVNDDQKPQFAGHVVAVVERAPGQLFSGMLGVLRPSSAATQQKQDAERRDREGIDLRNQTPQVTPKIIWFRPTDKRVPLIAIPTDQAPPDFLENHEAYADRLFVACIKRWPITSLHPFGTLVEDLGVIGDIETETNALLKDCNFSNDEFTEGIEKCLPPVPWVIPEREKAPEVRRDFRGNRVFTIDPETAKDLDDALHIVKNEDGTFEVGVHIADVTYFVKPNTPLDREARKRATTVYLVQKAVPMLPPTLSEELCSLTPGVDKLTFSVVFTMTAQGDVLSTWFGKSIINSAVKLAYSDAQEVIEGRHVPVEKIGDGEVRDQVESDILMLAGIARQLRAARFDNGALRIDNVKVTFGIDEEGFPEDCSAFVRKEANELIEEFMLLANISVAGKIASGLPEHALLRKHEAPVERRLNAFLERMNRLDIPLDGSSSGSLMKSFNLVSDENSRVTLQHLSTKSMQRAKYFCTGALDISKYYHYALNVPLYTHFTSPIRRYADIMVHRQLEAILTASPERFGMDTETVAKIAQVCNVKKDAARLAQEQSAHLFLCVLINDLTTRYGPVIRPATVIGVLDSAFDVLVGEFGIEKRVHMSMLPTERHVYDESSNTLEIYWQPGVNVLDFLVETNNDTHLKRVRHQVDQHARLMEATSGREHSESALFDHDDDAAVDDEHLNMPRPPKMTRQHLKSQDREEPTFELVEKTDSGHYRQTIRELLTVPVVISADMTKSPPIIQVVGLNPFVKEPKA